MSVGKKEKILQKARVEPTARVVRKEQTQRMTEINANDSEVGSEQVWLIQTDGELMDETDLYLDADNDASTLSNTDFMSPDRWPLQGTLVAKVNKGSVQRLNGYDWYPNVTAPDIISGQLRQLLLEICPDDVAFHPAEIRDSSGNVLEGWCPIVLNRYPCTDIERSVFDESGYINGVLFAFKEIRFLEGCMRGKDIVRNHTTSSQVLVSDRLKKAIENFNAHGVEFLRDEEIRM